MEQPNANDSAPTLLEPSLVGRTTDVDILQTNLHAAVRGAGEFLLVVGETDTRVERMSDSRIDMHPLEDAPTNVEELSLFEPMASLNIVRVRRHRPSRANAAGDLLLTLLVPSEIGHRHGRNRRHVDTEFETRAGLARSARGRRRAPDTDGKVPSDA